MDLKALKTFRHGNENVRRGAKVTMTEARGKEHVARGLVEEIKAPKPKAEKAKD
ncbi:hypothetical protein [Aurantimonas endophytica]|uniref:Uncharacterized protein n=1 Tax=Aurantimonas endophytica TaxID=1522175 RepID=A0A7W6HAZ3_9HYPH|nr:hypothetical protein [Aurantimonas endophytica]MBB4001588.1 hypothetical protein [Aurantimonas endophytica]MCO6402772.1 hypothetical protein [Aurantimonas endophytica]